MSFWVEDGSVLEKGSVAEAREGQDDQLLKTFLGAWYPLDTGLQGLSSHLRPPTGGLLCP
jgi:hypothetical protein